MTEKFPKVMKYINQEISKNLQDSKQNKNKIISRHLIAKLFGNSFILQMRKLKLGEVDSSL